MIDHRARTHVRFFFCQNLFFFWGVVWYRAPEVGREPRNIFWCPPNVACVEFFSVVPLWLVQAPCVVPLCTRFVFARWPARHFPLCLYREKARHATSARVWYGSVRGLVAVGVELSSDLHVCAGALFGVQCDASLFRTSCCPVLRAAD